MGSITNLFAKCISKC